MRLVKFPDGTQVRGAALSDRQEHDDWREFGLYLDESWHPSWPCASVAWEDFGLPTWPSEAAQQILKAFELASAGQHVEVGCKGGLGRTGTVLACMAILAGVKTAQAVAWVRQNYNGKAVETSQQENWVLWFADEMERRGISLRR